MAWSSLGGHWTSNTAISTKLLLLQSFIQNCLLSGLEAFVLPKSAFVKFDNFRHSKLAKIYRARWVDDEGHWHAKDM